MSRKRSYEGGGVEDNGGGMDLRRRILAWSLERERIETSLERERERMKQRFQVLGFAGTRQELVQTVFR